MFLEDHITSSSIAFAFEWETSKFDVLFSQNMRHIATAEFPIQK